MMRSSIFLSLCLYLSPAVSQYNRVESCNPLHSSGMQIVRLEVGIINVCAIHTSTYISCQYGRAPIIVIGKGVRVLSVTGLPAPMTC
ncbi:uncharacterized protein EI90DRAFT_2509036 [Cantharellus anzutake]|uniref:uncharacterized protein n=1 Tax=Cantharellus anzutake TaxID=1750568 RepID=UPI001907ECBC|nr:uncharacterized protein EI90DRAFT_2509036 [Cantharellus anzutake]KAF8321397.1 hypothetical protein EI90DRAFT_2509036 [Cantharellus anzutake]